MSTCGTDGASVEQGYEPKAIRTTESATLRHCGEFIVDRITKALLTESVDQNGLAALPEDQAFEQFAGYLVTSGHYSESFTSEDIAVGAGGDCGIDCIAVLVNGTMVTEPEETADLADTNGYLNTAS